MRCICNHLFNIDIKLALLIFLLLVYHRYNNHLIINSIQINELILNNYNYIQIIRNKNGLSDYYIEIFLK